jgi:mannose-6-phosphate isomerase
MRVEGCAGRRSGMAKLYPMRVAPRYAERIWGGDTLRLRLGKDAPIGKQVGESWEVYDDNAVLNGVYAGRTLAEVREILGEAVMGAHLNPSNTFPLLTKILDAREALSVQVHPDDRLARELEGEENGKTECWYIMHVDEGATLTYGFSGDVEPDDYMLLAESGRLDTVLRQVAVQPGDVVYLPGGMVHAVGAGIVLYEVQQTSDTTYRIYDWNRRDAEGRARELHGDKARRVLDFHRNDRGAVRPLQLRGGRTVLVAGEYFCNEQVKAGNGEPLSTHDSPVVVFALDGAVRVRLTHGGVEETLPPYSSLIVPAAAGSYTIEEGIAGPAHAIVSYVPESTAAVRADLLAGGGSADAVEEFLGQFAPLAGLGEPAV